MMVIGSANAVVVIPPGCTPASMLFGELKKTGELPTFIGEGPKGSTGFMTRSEAGEWTFILVDPFGCVNYSVGGYHSNLLKTPPGVPL